jgi:hypothetical protein
VNVNVARPTRPTQCLVNECEQGMFYYRYSMLVSRSRGNLWSLKILHLMIPHHAPIESSRRGGSQAGCGRSTSKGRRCRRESMNARLCARSVAASRRGSPNADSRDNAGYCGGRNGRRGHRGRIEARLRLELPGSSKSLPLADQTRALCRPAE